MKTDVNKVSGLSATGAYTLLIFISKEITLTIGKLGSHTLPKGFYAYTGSAFGKGSTNLKNRISRHTRKQKNLFWHIDYLLANPKVTIIAVVAAESSKKMECALNSFLESRADSKVAVAKFGASDCKANCQSHLAHFPKLEMEASLIADVVNFLESSVNVLSVVVFD